MVLFVGSLTVPAVLIQRVDAADPPHWYSSTLVIGCTDQCHTLHQAQGGQLTSAEGNVALCQSCHNQSGLAGNLPINSLDAAVPGSVGDSHPFDVPADNALKGVQLPLDNEMNLRIMDGSVVCSTCHNQHAAEATNGGTPKVGAAEKTVLGSPPGTGTMTSGGAFSGAVGMWYVIEIDTGGSQSNATFRWSKDNGTSWMTQGVPAGDGSPVALDDGVEVTFTGTGGQAFKVGERWEFYASYPFLRVPLDSGDNANGDSFCRDCHRDWVMVHDDGQGAGTRFYDGNPKSHPVGVALNANNGGYDRAVPLDGNGGEQGVDGDTNSSNDLALVGGLVQCTTCHGVHYADSNTQTVDAP